jgi:S1-C subfamily serine protease
VYTELDKNELKSIEQTLQTVTQKALPSVVTIKPAQEVDEPQIYSDHQSLQVEPASPFRSTFSGVLIDQRGHILTSDTVTQIGDQFSVVLENGSRRAARLVGVDHTAHLAVLKLQPGPGETKLPEFARGQPIEAGTWLVKLGRSATGHKSLSLAMVTGSTRQKTGQEIYLMNAEVTSEQDGGPAVNLEGQIIGINVSRLSHYSASGLIPVEYALNLAQKLISRAQASPQTAIGVQLQDLNDGLRQYFGVTQGIVVATVKPGSPAHQAGLSPMDVITLLNGQPVGSAKEAIATIHQTPLGTPVELTVRRLNTEQLIRVQPMPLPTSGLPAITLPEESRETILLLELHPVAETGEIQIQTILSKAQPKSLELLPGDIILSIDKALVRTITDVNRALQKRTNTLPQLWQIKRGQQVFFLALQERVVIG